MRLICAGGRDFTDVDYAVACLQRLHSKTPVTTLISGMARGGDMIGVAWARELGIPVEEYPIRKEDWQRHGNAAGPIRNLQMRDEGKPDCVLTLPGGRGTAHMVKIAQKAGIPTIVYTWEDYHSR